MASIPVGALILDLDEALNYFSRWTAADRATARLWIDKTEVSEFYVPPSGGYIAGHGGPNRSAYRDMPVNGLLMHVGFLHAWPNDADVGGDERVELSNSRGTTSLAGGTRTRVSDLPGQNCPSCHLVLPGRPTECDMCGYDFAAARAAVIARWEATRRS